MIALSKRLIFTMTIMASSLAFAIETSDVDAYTVKYAKVEKLSVKAMDAGYKILDQAIDKSEVESVVTTWLKPTLDLTILLLKHDPSNFSLEIFQPVYAKRRAEVNKLLEELPAKDRRLFKKYMKYYDDHSDQK